MEFQYLKQVALLVRILPIIAQEKDFALHGGTAINLFYFDMPRLSVDIDLTYLPFQERKNDLQAIEKLLHLVKHSIVKIIPGVKVNGPKSNNDEHKLFCTLNGADVKIEVNTINRGTIYSPAILPLCKSAQEEFNMFCEVPVVPMGQLFGGKIVAALDRQHPRDLFDVKNIIDQYGFAADLIEGFIFCLLCSKRPFHEILNPTFLDQSSILNNQFSGMTNFVFNYEVFQETRTLLLKKIIEAIPPEVAKALIETAHGKTSKTFLKYMRFPGVQWKILNIEKLKKINPNKHNQQVEALVHIFKGRY